MKQDANPRYLEAVAYAVARHGSVKQSRKGTDFPYVIHPIRVAEILSRFAYREDVVVAGVLHDTVEDAGATLSELEGTFGARVATLVEKVSEPDKSLAWEERKRHAIERAATEEDQDVLGLLAADKLDNVLSLAYTLRAKNEETWGIFNAPQAKQHWYYRTMVATLLERDAANLLFRTLDAEVRTVFPDLP